MEKWKNYSNVTFCISMYLVVPFNGAELFLFLLHPFYSAIFYLIFDQFIYKILPARVCAVANNKAQESSRICHQLCEFGILGNLSFEEVQEYVVLNEQICAKKLMFLFASTMHHQSICFNYLLV